MMKRLGIDLGTSSLGWAIIDDARMENAPYGACAPSPIECGVVTFKEGMDREKSGNLKSRAAERRMKRAARRLIRRRKYRKFHILRVLIDNQMCPMKEESLKKWKDERVYPVDDQAFMEWLSATKDKNPYIDRKRAAEEVVDRETLGRALYHIAQRRGFKSSKKEQIGEAEEEAEKETSTAEEETSKKGNAKKRDKDKDLTQTKAAIEQLTRALGGRTLGQYFYELYQEGKTIRGRKTGRIQHYEKELAKIFEVQTWVAKDLAKTLHDIIVFQRPLKIQRHLVGWCELEKKKYRRCLESHPSYQRFALLSLLNNIRIKREDSGDESFRPLTPEEREHMVTASMRVGAWNIGELMANFNRKFTTRGEKPWVCRHRDITNVPILQTAQRFSRLGIPEDKWQMALNALVDFQDMDRLREWAKKRFGFDDNQATRFIAINPSTERARYSLHTINLLLPWLERGYQLSKAIFLAKLPSVIPNFEKYEKELLERFDRVDEQYKREKEEFAYRPNAPQLEPLGVRRRRVFDTFCTQVLGWDAAKTEEAYAGLYIDTTATDIENPILPAVEMGAIKNPMVLHALTILRRLVNNLRRNGKIDADTVINIELARNVNSANLCRAIEHYQIERAKERERDRARLEECLRNEGMTEAVSDELLLRYRLWEEQEYRSAYTGQPISFSAMVRDCDIEHTLPRARGGTNKQENLTLCESDYNRRIKNNQLPSECPNAQEHWEDPETGTDYPPIWEGEVLKNWTERLRQLEDNCRRNKPHRGTNPEAYAAARQRYLQYEMERRYWAEKLSFFRISNEKAGQPSFMPRQLVDTGSITKFAVDFLKTRYPQVHSRNGAATAFARKAWGMQAEDAEKDRTDHVHHALDAIVIAALDPWRFQQICTELGEDRTHNFSATCPPPYPHFGEMAHHAVESILVRNIVPNKSRKPFVRVAKRKKIRLATPVRQADGKVLHSVASQGSTVRGCLHKDTLYGKINHKGKEAVVLRKTIFGSKAEEFKKWIEAAVDESVKNTLKKQVAAYQASGIEASKLTQQKYWGPKDKDGTPDVNGIPLRKLRIFPKPKNPDVIRPHQFHSSGEGCHGRMYGSGGDLLQLEIRKNARGRAVTRTVSLLDTAKEDARDHENAMMILRPGMLAIAYKDSPKELRNFSPEALSKRMYVLTKFDGKGRCTFVYHREARPMTELAKWMKETHGGNYDAGVSQINFEQPERLMHLSMSRYLPHMLFEGIHFIVSISGELRWLNQDD